jgi:hypothetical protein
MDWDKGMEDILIQLGKLIKDNIKMIQKMVKVFKKKLVYFIKELLWTTQDMDMVIVLLFRYINIC